jgi:NADH:ubiquinone oxidoreductase subunit E
MMQDIPHDQINKYKTIYNTYKGENIMLKITVCIGSSCHIKGSRRVVEQLQTLITENNLSDKVDLGGTFCIGKCQQGVCVMVGEDFHSVTPESVEEFFAKEVLARV